MDEYFVVPKRVMESRTAQLQANKEPPEALEVLSLDNLINRIVKRKDISEWEKASQLTTTLERFLALKPRALPESENPVPSTVQTQVNTKEWTPEPVKRKPGRPRGRTHTPRRGPQATVIKKSARIQQKKALQQSGQGRKRPFKLNPKWIILK
jgi:hypothetical protein